MTEAEEGFADSSRTVVVFGAAAEGVVAGRGKADTTLALAVDAGLGAPRRGRYRRCSPPSRGLAAPRARSTNDEATRGNDVFMVLGEVDPRLLDAIERLPEVERLGRLEALAAFPETEEYFPFMASVGGREGRTIDRWPMVEGRRADPEAVPEIVVSETAANRCTSRPVAGSGCGPMPPSRQRFSSRSRGSSPAARP